MTPREANADLLAEITALRDRLASSTRENAELQGALAQASHREAATSEILGVIASSPADVQPIFDAIASRVVSLCDGFFSTVWRYDGTMIHHAADNYPTDEMRVILTKGYPAPAQPGTIVGQAISQSRIIHVADLLDDSTPPASRSVAIALGYRTVLCVPMLRDGVSIGAIAVARQEARPFSDPQIKLVQTFADQAVIAIENVRLFNETKEALEQQTATSDILRVISQSPTDVRPVFDTIVESVVQLCDGVSATVYQFDGDLIHLIAHHHTVTSAVREVFERVYPLPPSRTSVVAQAILDRVVIHVRDFELDPDIPSASREMARAVGHRSLVAVPMLRDHNPIGAISVGRRGPQGAPRPFSDSEIAVLRTFADQAVIAIENVRLFNETKEGLERQTATADILRVIGSSPTNVQPVFEAIARSGVSVCAALGCVVFAVEGDIVRVAATHGVRPERLERFRQEYPAPLATKIDTAQTIRERRVFHLADIEHNPNATASDIENARLAGYQTRLMVPMVHGDKALGLIAVTRDAPTPFSDQQVALLQTFADQAVIAITNVRLFTELQSSNRDLTTALDQQTATSEVLRVISRSQADIQPVFAAILDCAVRLCEADLGAICRVDNGLLVLVEIKPSTPEPWAILQESYPRPVDTTSLIGRAALEARVVHVPDTEDASAPAHVTRVTRGLGFRSQLSVPILRETRPIGVLALNRRAPGPFSAPQIELVQTFAEQAVIAIENARLLGELQTRTRELTRSVGELTALGDVSRALSSTLDLATVLTTIVSRAVQLSGLDGGVVFEYDEAAEEFVQRVATETGGALAEIRRNTRFRKGEGVLGRTAITLEPAQVPDITVPGAYESRLRENLIESGIRAILAVPMVREDRLIGCLAVTRNHPGEFPSETIELLRTFATQSALAIQNARLFREIEEKSRQLEAASQHKSEFMANMSHELRTPLNAIIGFSEVLADRMFGELNEKQEEYLKDIHASGTHLLSLINDILDLSKIEAGRMELELTDFDLPTALDNALTLVRERAGRRSITLQMRVDERLGEVRADERKIRQVVLNLLSNAIKFTPEGGRIEVRASSVDGSVEVSVSDTGVGIAPEDQEAVFEEFRQVGTAEKKAEGTGLGLTLCRKFIELHGGRIWVKSQVGAGSTFTFTIPVHRGE